MKLLRRIFSRPRRVIVRPRPALPETQLARMLLVPDEHPVWVAVMQVLDEAEEEGVSGAQSSVASHGICASSLGGAEFVARVRNRLFELREKGQRSAGVQAAGTAAR